MKMKKNDEITETRGTSLKSELLSPWKVYASGCVNNARTPALATICTLLDLAIQWIDDHILR